MKHGLILTASQSATQYALAAMLAVGGLLVKQASVHGIESTILEVVKSHYEHGIPYEQAAKFGASEVPALLNILSDQKQQEYWRNAVFLLGVIGDERAFAPLVKLVEDQRGEINPLARRAASYVPFALGHLAGNGSENALNYLLESATPECWEKKLAWTYGGKKAGDLFAEDFAKAALMGLGISAQPKALEFLGGIFNSATSPSVLKITADEAIRLAADIRAFGRRAVFTRQWSSRDQKDVSPAQPMVTPGLSTVGSAKLPDFNPETAQLQDLLRLQNQAVAAYESIRETFLKKNYEALATQLAVKGQPILENGDADVEKREAVIRELKSRNEKFETTKQLLREAEQLGQQAWGQMRLTILRDDLMQVVVPIERSQAITAHHGIRKSSDDTVDNDGRLRIYLIRKNGRWYWNPFGW